MLRSRGTGEVAESKKPQDRSSSVHAVSGDTKKIAADVDEPEEIHYRSETAQLMALP